jgi:hypothetical protein
MEGLNGMLTGVGDMLRKAQEDLQTDEEKRKFAEKLEQSGIIKEFENVREKFKDINK